MPKTKRVEWEMCVMGTPDGSIWKACGIHQLEQNLWLAAAAIEAGKEGNQVWAAVRLNQLGYHTLPATVVVEVPDEK